ncbi:tspO/MBR family domain-containing protein [Ditylenchus destructor]|nr:tspO/MBR family domain-containing protein [Ditylenchus destructor]
MDIELHENAQDLFKSTNQSNSFFSSGTMPYLWTNIDTRNAAIATTIPIGAAILGASAVHGDRNLQSFFKGFRPPNWAIRDIRIYTALDLATIAPLGYASYLVYKHGGGFDYTDTSVALGIYGVNIASALALIPNFKKKNLKCISLNALAVAATAIGAAVAFGKIDKSAGYLLIPYALWTSYYAALAIALNNNDKKHPPETIQ